MGHRSRRFSIVILVGALTLVVASCSSSKKTTTNTTTGSGTATNSKSCKSGLTLGFFGALTGSNSPQLGINEAQGEQLAIDQFNASHSACHIGYTPFDSQGDPAQAPALATNAVGEANVVGVIGPAFSGESKAADPIFNQAGLPTITVSATNTQLSQMGWTIFHRAVANDDAQGPADANFIANTLHAKSVAVIDDASAYGKGLADIVRANLKDAGVTVTSPGSIDLSHNYPATVNAVKAANVDVVFYGGYYTEAGPLALQLKNAGVTATFMSGDGSLAQGFVQGAGDAANGAYLSAPAVFALTATADKTFVSQYTAKWGGPPQLYSGEAYDATNQFLAAISAGNYTRPTINHYISTVPYKGLLKTYSYGATGELVGTPIIFFHKVVNDQITLFSQS
jgi:branched-chain amino acid transport system substrate-binding protein